MILLMCMQNENIQSVNSPQTRNEPIEQEQVDKERKIAKQKKVFLTLSYTFGSVFLAVILLSFGPGIYNRYFAPKTPIVVNPKQEEPKEENSIAQKRKPIEEKNPAFHEKKEKNKKVNLGGSYRRELAKKYKKPKTKGDKIANRKKKK